MSKGGSRGLLVVRVGRYSGLGNRMRVVLSAQSLAEAEQREFRYCWPVNKRFGAKLTDLWHYERPLVSRVISRAIAARYPYRDAGLSWVPEARDERIWQIRSGQPIPVPDGAVPWTTRLQGLAPVAQVADAVRAEFDQNLRGRPYVGVMIRAHQHSHRQTLEMSPVSWFLDRMRQLRAGRPDLAFYVSCDVDEVKRAVLAEIPDCFARTTAAEYNSAAAVRDSVIDTYLLAGSSHLLGPHYSSFPELALHLAGPGLDLETSVTPSARAGDFVPWTQVDDPVHPSVRA